MRLILDATPDEISVKGNQLISELSKSISAFNPDLADLLEKAIPEKEEVLKYPVLRTIADRCEGIYKQLLEEMLGEIDKVVKCSNKTTSGVLSKGVDIEDSLECSWLPVPESVGDMMWKSQWHKYIRRVPYTDSHGTQKYRYYYKESTISRTAITGEDIKLGMGTAKVTEVEENGDVTLQIGTETKKVDKNGWNDLMVKHYGESYYSHVEKKAKQTINAVLRHVPKALLEDLKGDNDKDRLADLKSRVPDVYLKLQVAFNRSGMSSYRAKEIISDSLARRGWASESRGLIIGSVLTPQGAQLAKSYKQVMQGAENLAGGTKVEPRHVAAAIELRLPRHPGDTFGIKVGDIAKEAEKDLERLQKLLNDAQTGGKGAEMSAVLAQALAFTSHSLQQVQMLATAYPGSKDKLFEDVRTTMLQVPSVAARKVPTTTGAVAELFVSGEGGAAKALKARYRLMEADAVIPSHNPNSFAKNEKYPKGLQERAYHRDKAEQVKVRLNAEGLFAPFIINTNSDAVNGPPIVTKEGIVLGGNSRAMSMQLAYKSYPSASDKMRTYLRAHAYEVGLTEGDVDAMKAPILVRELDLEDNSHAAQKLLVRSMNESFTQAIDPRTYQVALGHKLEDKTIRDLTAAMDPDETLNQFLSSSRANGFIADLHRVGVIDRRNNNQYMHSGTNELNEDGKIFVQRILVGNLIDNADLLSSIPPGLMKGVSNAAPYIIQARHSGPGFDLSKDLELALETYSHIQRQVDLGKQNAMKADMSTAALNKLFSQIGIPGVEETSPIVHNEKAKLILECFVRKGGEKQLPKVFKQYAIQANKNQETAGMLGIADRLTPEQVFKYSVEAAIRKGAEEEAVEASRIAEAKRVKEETSKAKELGLFKAGGPYVGPRGGLWADPEHTQHWEPGMGQQQPAQAQVAEAKEVKPDTQQQLDFVSVNKESVSPAPEVTSKPAEPKAKVERKPVAKEDVEKLAQEIGEHVWGSRKDLAALRTSSDLDKLTPAHQAKVTTKKYLMPEWEAEDLLASGVEPGGVLVRKALESCIQAKAPDNLEGRKGYMEGIDFVTRSLDGCKSVQDIYDFLTDWKELSRGYKFVQEFTTDEYAQAVDDYLEAKGITGKMKWKERIACSRKLEQFRMAYYRAKTPEDTKEALAKEKIETDEAKRLGWFAWGDYQPDTVLGWKLGIDKSINMNYRDGGYRVYVEDSELEKHMSVGARSNVVSKYGFMLICLGEKAVKAVQSSSPDGPYGTKTPKAVSDAWHVATTWERTNVDYAKQVETLMEAMEGKKGGGTKREPFRWEREVPGNIQRVGGKEVLKADPKELADTFGFHNVQFGLWVNEEEADSHLRGAYGALLDLADILGTTPKTISLNGKLSIGFGARGKGNARAHYEPGGKIINLTKMAGGGSLAHEWAHAIDHLISVAANPDSTAAMPTMSGGVLQGVPRKVVKAMKEVMQSIRYTEVPDSFKAIAEEGEILDAKYRNREQLDFADQFKLREYYWERSKLKKSDFLAHAEAFSSSADGYYTRPHELFARAFESAIEDILTSDKRESSYLVAGTKVHYHTNKFLGKEGEREAQPYPQGETRERIGKAVKGLIEALREEQALEKALKLIDDLQKAGGPFIGPRGGKWANAELTIPWTGATERKTGKQQEATQPQATSQATEEQSGQSTQEQPEEPVQHFTKELEGGLPKGKTPAEHVELVQSLIVKHTESLGTTINSVKQLIGSGEVTGRVKTLASTLGKLVRKKDKYPSADKLQDLTGVRVIHKSVTEVKDTVAKLKQSFKVLDEEDYISTPRELYRSYHLTLEGPNGLPFEMQVRTKNQDTFATWNHNLYKPTNEIQEKYRTDPVVAVYEKEIAEYFWRADSGGEPIPKPPCTEVVHQSFGCL